MADVPAIRFSRCLDAEEFLVRRFHVGLFEFFCDGRTQRIEEISLAISQVVGVAPKDDVPWSSSIHVVERELEASIALAMLQGDLDSRQEETDLARRCGLIVLWILQRRHRIDDRSVGDQVLLHVDPFDVLGWAVEMTAQVRKQVSHEPMPIRFVVRLSR